MHPVPAILIERLSHRYGDRLALAEIGIEVQAGEIFGLLGPNGGGKTTLFRLLSTLLPIQTGNVRILGTDVADQPGVVRRLIGVTFQSPSLDRKLTVHENLTHQGHLYGLSGDHLRKRLEVLLAHLGLSDRGRDRVESLSGGLARRVEIAKGLLHNPQLLLLDEPSTGLDPGARLDLWRYMGQLRDTSGVTILVTTHLMEEAERCDRLGILDDGKLIAIGTPAELRSSIGGDCVTINATDPESLAQRIATRFGLRPQLVGRQLRIEIEQGGEFVGRLTREFGDEIASMTLGKPTLEDVFVERTGHRFWSEEPVTEGRS